MTRIKTSRLYTLERYISEEQEKYPEATGEFTGLMHDLTFAFRIISREVRRAGLNDILGLTDDINVHGEQVRRIDEYANEVILRSMDHSGHLCAMVSEESDELISIPKEFKKGKYILLFDPLDGSSNIDVNITIGTIFSLLRRDDMSSDGDAAEVDVLKPGYEQVAAGYVLYGSSTIFVYTTGHGVNEFTYDPTIGEWLLTYENIRIPEFAAHYSVNEANSNKWDYSIQQYLDYIKEDKKEENRPYTLRYVATAVADVHRILHNGGIYMYPAEKRKPNGKIRLLYEANPLSWIVEQAGGASFDGKGSILNIKPYDLHQRTPVFIGSTKNIQELKKFINEYSIK